VVIHAREEVDFNRYRFVIHVCNVSFRLGDDLNGTNSVPVIAWFMKSTVRRFWGSGRAATNGEMASGKPFCYFAISRIGQ
jgi:hypothetical protein